MSRQFRAHAVLLLLLASMALGALAAPPADAPDLEEPASVLPVLGRTGDVAAFGGAGDVVLTIQLDATDQLNTPRDLEFHPARTDELWIVNRADDSAVIVDDAGLPTQSSEWRKDGYAYHFMEEVSAIAFGNVSGTHGVAFGTAQESRNTYDGQAQPNDFMGPALWPSNLSEFARVHQNGPLLGSHIDMLHESPLGMGMAHDEANAYWYFDGFYNTLVYYDFAMDHDVGMDDHSDGVVRRYTEVVLTRVANVPGHMELDHRDGMLYIADTGTGRVLWVDTDDPVTLTPTTYGQLEPLDEYSNVTGASFGTFATGLNQPSGIALEGDVLYVSTHGDGVIRAYDVTNGSLLGSLSTGASAIMGLEVGPQGHLWYVDAVQNRVVRIDPDQDSDGHADGEDVCPLVANADQADHDGDGDGDLCDDDRDGDTILDADDACPMGRTNWLPVPLSDLDHDGCRDVDEDDDDDGDGLLDTHEDCPAGTTNWTSDATTDHDGDGCADADEDLDDDADGICDAATTDMVCSLGANEVDACPRGELGWTSVTLEDRDRDGCRDITEDTDDDDDGILDADDGCPTVVGTSSVGDLIGCPDDDGDGVADTADRWPLDPTQTTDTDGDGYGDAANGTAPDACPTVLGSSTVDRLGCLDSDLDGVSDPDATWTVADGADPFPDDGTQWSDADGDGHGDNWANESWSAVRNSSWPGQHLVGARSQDACPLVAGTSTLDVLGCLDSDGDGWSDLADQLPLDGTQVLDTDGDGYGANLSGHQPDACPSVFGTSTAEGHFGCPDADGDGWADDRDAFADNATLWLDSDGDGFSEQAEADQVDACPAVAGTSTDDRFGCPDADGDGVSDDADAFPDDASRHAEASLLGSPAAAGLAGLAGVAAVVAGGALVFLLLRERGTDSLDPTTLPFPGPDLSLAPPPMMAATTATPDATTVAPATPDAPPIPAEGLPPGWTMEQWAHYGPGWLEEQGRA